MRKKSKHFRFIGLVVVAALFLAMGQSYLRMQSSLGDGQPSGAQSKEAELVAVTFSSRWCGPCKILKPRLASIKPNFENKPVRFVELNFTFGDNQEFATLATEEGFSDVYQNYRNATGFTVLVDKDTGKVMDILTIDQSESAMQEKITKALQATV